MWVEHGTGTVIQELAAIRKAMLTATHFLSHFTAVGIGQSVTPSNQKLCGI